MRRADDVIGWLGIVKLGLVQASLGAIVVLATSTLNRVMVVELALPALIPGALVGWHYGVQLSRPRWGHGADIGGRRTPWIFGGILTLAAGGTAAALATAWMQTSFFAGLAAAFAAFFIIGVGVGASGTNLLALLATKVPPARKAAAAAIVWIMMILGFVLTSLSAGALLDPFSMQRLVLVSAGVGTIAVLLTALALVGVESGPSRAAAPASERRKFMPALKEVWNDPQARRFSVFVFVSMIAYSAQDLILEPLGGLLYSMTPGETTKLSGVQNGGVLIGMVATAVVGSTIGKSSGRFMRQWTVFGCIASAAALGALAAAALSAGRAPLQPLVFSLGLANGAFAVAAIGSMMTLASAGAPGREGMRMGVWGASQAIAFGLGGFLGAVALDLARGFFGDPARAFALVFSLEGAAFLAAAFLAMRVGRTIADDSRLPAMPSVEAMAAE
jgi:BCD family chlorophyll transporter-like MFS transporter